MPSKKNVTAWSVTGLTIAGLLAWTTACSGTTGSTSTNSGNHATTHKTVAKPAPALPKTKVQFISTWADIPSSTGDQNDDDQVAIVKIGVNCYADVSNPAYGGLDNNLSPATCPKGH